jgi:hypothetical protein
VSGERPGYREAMERMTKRLQDSGMTAEKARKTAQDTARKHDQQQRDKGR